jgi:hypothetical protein
LICLCQFTNYSSPITIPFRKDVLFLTEGTVIFQKKQTSIEKDTAKLPFVHGFSAFGLVGPRGREQ